MSQKDDEKRQLLLDNVAMFFSMLGDSGRIKIIDALLDGEQCVRCLSERVGSSQSAVSHQLRLLRTADIVKSRREGKNILYSLNDDHVRDVFRIGVEHISHKGGR